MNNPILQMSELRYIKVKTFPWGHSVRKWQDLDSNLALAGSAGGPPAVSWPLASPRALP